MLAPGPVVSPWPQVACVCAASKFAFVIAGIVFMVLYTSVGLWLSRRGEPQA
jgi:hypothetical protein